MEQNYSLMAQSRANYYTAGSPVQFVRVELLKGDVNGEVAVCLTFKNVGTEPLTDAPFLVISSMEPFSNTKILSVGTPIRLAREACL